MKKQDAEFFVALADAEDIFEFCRIIRERLFPEPPVIIKPTPYYRPISDMPTPKWSAALSQLSNDYNRQRYDQLVGNAHMRPYWHWQQLAAQQNYTQMSQGYANAHPLAHQQALANQQGIGNGLAQYLGGLGV